VSSADTPGRADDRRCFDLGDQLTKFQPGLLALARRITRDEDAALDVVQRAFLKVSLHIDQYEGRAALGTWVGRIVSNEAVTWERSRRRRDRLSADVVACGPWRHEPLKPIDVLERKRTIECVRRALEALSPRDRELVEETLDGDRTAIARLSLGTGVGQRTLRTRLHRARKKLRALLDEP